MCVSVNLINDWQWSPAALVICLDQCYKQGVKGLPSASRLNDWPLVPLDGWKCSNINDHIPCRPVARWNEQRGPQPPITINGPELACLPFVISYPTCGPLWTHAERVHQYVQNVGLIDLRKNTMVNGRTFIFSYICVYFFDFIFCFQFKRTGKKIRIWLI